MVKIKKIFLSCILFASCAISQADEISASLMDQFRSGNPKSIANYCEQNIRQKINQSFLDESRIEALLDDRELVRNCYIAIFCKQICPKNQYLSPALKDKDFAQFLLNHTDLLKDLAFSRKGNALTLEFLYQVWLLENKNLEKTNLNMVAGAALSLSSKEQIEDRIARYQFYQESRSKGELFAQFDTLRPWEMAILFNSGRSLDELSWAQTHTAGKKNYTAQKAGDTACSFIPYRMKNKNDISIHEGSKFYDFKPETLQILVEYGGVCGAVSTAACGFIGAKGIPAYPVGQPGHCAFVWKGLDGSWKIGNNIYGWVWTGNRNLSPWPGHSYMISVVAKFQDHSQFERSWLCHEFSKYAREEKNRNILLDCATRITKWNLPAWEDSLRLKSKNMGEKDRIALIAEIAKSFKDEPIIMQKLVNEGLGVRPGKNNTLQIAALILDSSTSRDSSEMYMMELAKEAKTAIPSLADKLDYNVKTRKNYFNRWDENAQRDKFPGQAKKQTCNFLEKTIPDLHRNPSMTRVLLDVYTRQLLLWDDPKYQERGISFLKQQLQSAQQSVVSTSIAEAGAKLAKHLGKQNDIAFFTNVAGAK